MGTEPILLDVHPLWTDHTFLAKLRNEKSLTLGSTEPQ